MPRDKTQQSVKPTATRCTVNKLKVYQERRRRITKTKLVALML